MGFKKSALIESGDNILGIAWSPDGLRLQISPATGPVLVAGVDGQVLNELPGHALGNGAGDWGVTCGFDGRLILGERAIRLGKGWIERAKWSPDRTRLATALGRTLFLLDAEGEIVAEFPGHQTSVADFVWHPGKSNEIATVGGGGARMWRLGEKEPFARFDWGGASLTVAWSANGRWLATGDQTPSVHLYDFTRDHPLHIQGYETKVKAMSFSPDSIRLATGGAAVITVWNCTGTTGPENTTPAQLPFHKGDVEALAWSPNGDTLASGDVVGRVVFSDTRGKPVSAFEDDSGLSVLSWSPDGNHCAAGDESGRVVVFSRV